MFTAFVWKVISGMKVNIDGIQIIQPATLEQCLLECILQENETCTSTVFGIQSSACQTTAITGTTAIDFSDTSKFLLDGAYNYNQLFMSDPGVCKY